ncbi:TPA: glycosyl transferase, partial [candidate division WWE3 bacterium]|nr:glycosyl transferase [candidate division WWE3 bacterium]
MKLSIVVPVYNEKNTIEKILGEIKAVESLDKEIIVVDDASTDGTTDILKRLEKEHPDVRFFY